MCCLCSLGCILICAFVLIVILAPPKRLLWCVPRLADPWLEVRVIVFGRPEVVLSTLESVTRSHVS